jgi:hypothetical protein
LLGIRRFCITDLFPIGEGDLEGKGVEMAEDVFEFGFEFEYESEFECGFQAEFQFTFIFTSPEAGGTNSVRYVSSGFLGVGVGVDVRTVDGGGDIANLGRESKLPAGLKGSQCIAK